MDVAIAAISGQHSEYEHYAAHLQFDWWTHPWIQVSVTLVSESENVIDMY